MTPPRDENTGASNQRSGQLANVVEATPALSMLRPVGRSVSDFPDDDSDLADTFRDLFRVAAKRKWLILAIAAAILALGTARTLMTTPLYTSTLRLQIDRNVAKIVDGGSVIPAEGSDTEFLRTQYELLQSRSLAERVAAAANLADDPGFLRPRDLSLLSFIRLALFPAPAGTSNPTRRQRTEAAAGIVHGNLEVKPVPGARLVDLSYTDPNPGRSQRIAAAYADAFIASNLDKRFEANAYAKTFLGDQIKQLKLRLEQSEKTMLAFAEKEQIVAVNEASSIAESNLSGANVALGNITSERIKNEQSWRQVEHSDTVNFPQFLSNAVVDGLRTKRNELVTSYQEKLETFKPGYPAMIQIANKISEIDRQLASEIKTVRASLKSAYESSRNQESELKARVEMLRAEVLDFQKRSIQYNILKREVDTNRSLYNGLLQRLKEVDIAAGVGSNNVFVVDTANFPSAPSSPRLLRAIILLWLGGIAAGFGVAYLIEKLDDVIETIEDAERVGGLTVLGIIPFVRNSGGAEQMLHETRSPISEAYRSLCTSLQFASARGMPKSLLITSADPSEGKSITSLAIAQHFSRLGLNVLLVDADMRNPSLHKRLAVDNEIGLSSYLAGECEPPEAIQKTQIPNLAFLCSGPLPPNAADLLSSSRLMSLISLSLEVFDLVIIDGPPILGIADAPLLSNAAEATAFVIGAGIARAGSVRGALKRLDLAKSPLIGSVVTKVDARRSGYGYGGRYGYGYGYAYGYDYGRSHSAAAGRTPAKVVGSPGESLMTSPPT